VIEERRFDSFAASLLQSNPNFEVEAPQFFEFDRPAIGADESPQQYSTRLLAQLAITGKSGGEDALDEALAQAAGEQGSLLPVSG
jgi:hypothetical protein